MSGCLLFKKFKKSNESCFSSKAAKISSTASFKLVFISFKIRNFFYKNPIPDDFKSFLVHKFTCAGCSSSYIGEACCHFKTRIEELIKRITSLIFLDIYAPLQHDLTRIILFLLK